MLAIHTKRLALFLGTLEEKQDSKICKNKLSHHLEYNVIFL